MADKVCTYLICPCGEVVNNTFIAELVGWFGSSDATSVRFGDKGAGGSGSAVLG